MGWRSRKAAAVAGEVECSSSAGSAWGVGRGASHYDGGKVYMPEPSEVGRGGRKVRGQGRKMQDVVVEGAGGARFNSPIVGTTHGGTVPLSLSLPLAPALLMLHSRPPAPGATRAAARLPLWRP